MTLPSLDIKRHACRRVARGCCLRGRGEGAASIEVTALHCTASRVKKQLRDLGIDLASRGRHPSRQAFGLVSIMV